MARWKVAGNLAMAMREAERQAAEKRLMEEQRVENIKNCTMLRSIRRSQEHAAGKAKASFLYYQRWFHMLEAETEERRREVGVAKGRQYQLEDGLEQRKVLASITAMDTRLTHLQQLESAIEMVRLKEKETEAEIRTKRQEVRRCRQLWRQLPVPEMDQVENRVQLAQEQLGRQLEENKCLAQMIDNLLIQRDQVKNMLTELKHHLDDLSRQLLVHIEEAQSTYEQRDLHKRNMQKLKEHMARSSTAHATDMQSMQFKINVLRKMEDFMLTKNKFRADEGRERRKMTRGLMSSTKREVLMLSELLAKVKSDLQEEDMTKIVTTFKELQAENFMLFANISHVREGCHQLRGLVEAKRKEVKHAHHSKEQEKVDSQAKRADLLQNIDYFRQLAEGKEKEVQGADDVIQTYMQAVHKILTNMNYGPEDIKILAGGFRKIEERNIGTFLAEIEHFVNHLHLLGNMMEHMRWMRARRLSLSMTGGFPEALPPRQNSLPRVVVVPPQTEGWKSMEEQEEECPSLTDLSVRPLELWELKAMVEEGLGAGGADEQCAQESID